MPSVLGSYLERHQDKEEARNVQIVTDEVKIDNGKALANPLPDIKTTHTEDTLAINVSLKRPYCNVFLAICILFFSTCGYYILAGSLTSLHRVLGFVSLGLQWSAWIVSSLLVPLVIDLVGLKITTIAGSICYLIFTLCNFYPSWYTMIPGSILIGLGYGVMFIATPAYINQNAPVIAQGKPGNVEENSNRLISILQGVLMFWLRLGTAFGNVITSVFLFTDPLFQNSTSSLNQSDVCDKPITLVALSPSTYYAIVGTAAFIGVIPIILAMFLSNDHKDGIWKSKGKAFKDMRKKLYSICWMMKKPSYLLPLAGAFLPGLMGGFYTGSFTKHFVSECVGIAYIGVAVIIWSIATFLMFLAVGKVTLYITRTATAIVVSAIHIAVCLFLIFWSREPNFIMIVLTSLLFGVIIAFWAVGPIIYYSINGKRDKLTTEVLAPYWIFFALGGAFNYFISTVISIEANLWLLVGVTIVAISTYVVAEFTYGERVCRREPDAYGVYELRTGPFI